MLEHPTAYLDWSREEVLPYVPTDATLILDVGCSRGGFGKLLKQERPAVVVWGVEPDAQAAASASSVIDHVVEGLFPASMPPSAPKFDVVCFNDVLEHMVDPWSALVASRHMLADGGVVVASLPNVRHWSVVNRLVLKADFSYSAAGILDRTHVRFFTRSTMLSMMNDSGFDVVLCEPLNVSKYRKIRLLGLVFPRLAKDLLTLQYVIVAKPRAT